jgi:hypothetical protein
MRLLVADAARGYDSFSRCTKEAKMGAIASGIEAEICSWPGVQAGPHRFGGREFRAAGHEIGHLHGDRLADLPFPVDVRRELVESGRAQAHHVLPDTGWVSYRIHSAADVPGAVALFRLNYDRIIDAGPADGEARTRVHAHRAEAELV